MTLRYLILLLVATVLPPRLPVFAQPPMGVTSEAGTTTFRVWAPHARSVAVIGDFNNWKPSQTDHLTRENEQGVWSLTMKRGRPRGAYKFLINGQLARRDPYGRAVTPDGNASLFYDPAAFVWENDRGPRYALEDLVIYEMHIGAFFDPKPDDGEPGTFADAARKLDYLVELGVNTLCILPVHEFNGRHSWGYNPSDPFAVEQAYGGPDGLKQFVRAAHARGLAVHLDIVHNHYGPQNLDLLQFDGSGNPRNGGIYFFEGDEKGMTPWGPRVRFDEPMVQQYVRDNVMMWLEEYRVDGFRWDSTINIRAYNLGAAPIPSGLSTLNRINDEISRRFPGAWSIAEDSYGIGNFHASWDYDFHHQVMPVLAAPNDAGRAMNQLSMAIRRAGDMPRVIYVDNHDEAGKINGMQRIASDVAPADPGGDLARRMVGLGAVLTFTSPGIPLLFMGNEFQEYGTFHDDRPLDWNKTTRHAGTLALHRALIGLRRNRGGFSGGLKGDFVQAPLVDQQAKTLVVWRGHAANPADQVVIVYNLSGVNAEITAPFPSPGPWLQRLNTDDPAFGGAGRKETPRPFTLAESAKAKVTLPPYSARIYALVDRPAPSARTTRPAGAPVSAAAPTTPVAAPPPAKPALSMYAALHLRHDHGDRVSTQQAFALTSDYQWEGRFVLRGVEQPAFRISANDDGVIFWGRQNGAAPMATSYAEVTARRLGEPFAGQGTWNGLYRVRFNEDTLLLEIEREGEAPAIAAAPESTPDIPSAAADDGQRTWTDTRGATVVGRLIEANDVMVGLVKPDGARLQVPLTRLSEADRAYVQSWRDAQDE